MLDAAADIKTIQCFLGHSNLESTQIYTQKPKDQLHNKYKKYMRRK